jgi:hypothetical protein
MLLQQVTAPISADPQLRSRSRPNQSIRRYRLVGAVLARMSRMALTLA